MAFGMIGKVAVPSHWFQILLFQSTDQNKKINYQLEIYLFPNEDNYKGTATQHYGCLCDRRLIAIEENVKL